MSKYFPENVEPYPNSSCSPETTCTKLQAGAHFPENCMNDVILYSTVSNNCPTYPNITNAINPGAIGKNLATNFGRTNCSGQIGTVTYYSWDPRLFDSPRAQHLLLDTPPYTQTTKLANVYTENLRNYGKIPGGYDTVNDGDITYYAGKDRADAPFRPIFTSENSIKTSIYNTPMSGILPAYEHGYVPWRNPVTNSTMGNTCGLTENDDTNWLRQQYIDDFSGYLQQRVVRGT